jgi:hypothetical protein
MFPKFLGSFPDEYHACEVFSNDKLKAVFREKITTAIIIVDHDSGSPSLMNSKVQMRPSSPPPPTGLAPSVAKQDQHLSEVIQLSSYIIPILKRVPHTSYQVTAIHCLHTVHA